MRHLDVLPETTLVCGALRAVLAPAAGGRISALYSDFTGTSQQRIDWLQPLDESVRTRGFDSTAWPKAGLYPLVPYSNRIAQGHFEWDGRQVQLPLHPGESHALHGGSQQRPWALTQYSERSATMVYTHAAGDDGWPWPYRAEHAVTLDDQGAALRLQITSTGDTPMPCGAGFHPYFPARFSARVGFSATTVWPPDAQFLGTAPQPAAAADDYRAARAVPEAELTQYYSDWDGRATLSARDGARIQLTADKALRHLVLYRPAGRDFFCVEPVSHVSNAVHLTAQGHDATGWSTLAPGQVLTCHLRMALSA